VSAEVYWSDDSEPPRVASIPETAAEPTTPAKGSASGQDQKITPFDVQGGTDADGKSTGMWVNCDVTTEKANKCSDYDQIVKQWGSSYISEELLQKFERLTGRKPHPLLRRGTFFSHR
jgi:tryptophanyl-tRNA synthetase